MKKFATSLVLGLVLVASPTTFANEIDAKDPQKIAELLKSSTDATDIKVEKHSSGTPYIVFKQNAVKQAIIFDDCDKNNKNCTTLQFVATWSDTKHTLQNINDWNSSKKFTTAYLDDDGDPVLEMSLDLTHKVSKNYLKKYLKIWDSSTLAFQLQILALK